jgi:hypothetical protein
VAAVHAAEGRELRAEDRDELLGLGLEIGIPLEDAKRQQLAQDRRRRRACPPPRTESGGSN